MRFIVFLRFLLKLVLYFLWQCWRFCSWSLCRKKPQNVPFKDFLQ